MRGTKLDATAGKLDAGTELHLAVGTVKRHVYNVFRKLDVTSRVGAVAAGTRLGLLA